MLTDTLNVATRFLYRQSIGLLILRVVTGLVFVMHGSMKIGHIDIVAGFFTHLGIVTGAVGVAWFIALLEVVGGAALILGVATRLFGLLLGIEMIVAIFMTGVGRGWGQHEFELLLAAASLAIALSGSGKFSLYKMECGHCGGMCCNGKTCKAVE